MAWVAALFLVLILPPPSNTFLITGLDLSLGGEENTLTATHPSPLEPSERGETFKVTRSYRMTTVTFSVFRNGEPTVNLIAVLYHSANGIPLGEPIARSFPVNASTVVSCGVSDCFVGPRQLYALNFTFQTSPLLLPGRDYAVAIRTEGPGIIGFRNIVWVSYGGTRGRYPGDSFYFAGRYHRIIDDVLFQVYGKLPSKA